MRRLCAILAADVVGYSRLIREDEARTLERLRALRSEVIGPILSDHGGRLLKSMGDGWLAAFDTGVDAVNAAMRIQDRQRGPEALVLRMGVHIGDVTEAGDDYYGDGINIAARLEAEAPEGGLLISDAAYSNLDGTLSPSFSEAGARRLKNIDRPVATWLRAPDTAPANAARSAPGDAFPVLAISPVSTSDTRPDIIDLATSLTADLHTYFNSAAWLTARIETAPVPGAYRLHPALRSRGERLRLETRLMGPDGGTIWTHKSDTTLDDSFDWQDDTVDEISGHGTDLLLEAEHMRLAAIPPDALSAEQHQLMGIMAWRTFSLTSFIEAIGHHERAIALDPDLAGAYADAITVTIAGRTMVDDSSDIAAYMDKIPDWVEAGRPRAPGHPGLMYAVALADFMADGGQAALNRTVEQVIRMTPFDPRLLSHCGWAYLWSGQTQTGLECFEKSLRFGLRGPFTVAASGGAATACVQLGRDADALRHCDRGLALSDEYPTLFSTKAAALALLGRQEEAEAVMAIYRSLLPYRTVTNWRSMNDYNGAPGAERYFEGLRLAGLPEG